MSLICKHGAVLQAWACLALVQLVLDKTDQTECGLFLWITKYCRRQTRRSRTL